MAYVKVSIPRNEDGGAPTIKNATVILIDINDVETEPSRELGNTEVSGDFALKTGAKAVGIYATPSTVIPTEEPSGEVDSRGIIKGVEYVHPGNSVAIANHTEAYLNRGVIALVKECDGSSAGKCLVIGTYAGALPALADAPSSEAGA